MSAMQNYSYHKTKIDIPQFGAFIYWLYRIIEMRDKKQQLDMARYFTCWMFSSFTLKFHCLCILSNDCFRYNREIVFCMKYFPWESYLSLFVLSSWHKASWILLCKVEQFQQLGVKVLCAFFLEQNLPLWLEMGADDCFHKIIEE